MKIASIFQSIDGEVSPFLQGRQTVFIRLARCNLRCSYCDTKYAQTEEEATEMSLDEVISAINKFNIQKVTITGGEPLLQHDEVLDLCRVLSLQFLKKVTIETNGAIVPSEGWKQRTNVFFIMDWKLPSSGMESFMLPEAFTQLFPGDVVKFVIADRIDFDRALEVRKRLKEGTFATFAFSPAFGALDPRTLISWLENSGVRDAVVSVQLHKILGLVEDQR